MKHKGIPIGKHEEERILLSNSQYEPTAVHAAKSGSTSSQVSDIKSWGRLSLCLKFNRKSPLPVAAFMVPRTCAKRKAIIKK